MSIAARVFFGVTMPWLPPLVHHSNVYVLPLRDGTENQLCRVVLGGDLDGDAMQRSALLANALRADAAFALWSIIQIQRRQSDAPHTIEQLADALEGVLAELLEPCEVPDKLAEPAEVVKLYRHSLAVSQEAARSCTLPADQAAAELLGLLHNGADWLAMAAQSSAQASTSTEHTAALLPAWLDEQLSAISSNSVTAPIPLAVRLAIDAYQGDQLPEPPAVEPVSPRATFLPQFIARIEKLRTLETRFDEVLEAEKIASLQQFAYGLSHEINNPLANIATRSQTLLSDEPHPERRRKLNTINRQAFRAHEMIADAMLFAKPPPLEKRPVNIAELIAGVVNELHEEADEQDTGLDFDIPAELTLNADPNHLSVAIRAVCVNSLQALSSGGSVTLTARSIARSSADESESDLVQIAIQDTGPGIPAEVRRHLFDPYYSGREAGRGLGLGLSKCWRIVELHGGQMEVTSSEGVGTTFTINLPAMP
ncbi:MAG TPA: hypothetical protein DCY79_24875 [Planctomycetaceae bacterium]|nr:hypothetical protein [Blastopirellula sp.]HAY83053.1 hypothetical protein [Planctomycetaceae bacterium]